MTYRPLDDYGFIADAFDYCKHSKDPSTQVGAIILRPDRTCSSHGFNGFPRGVHDDPARYDDRTTKYALVVHAEANAIVTAREPLHGHTLYCTMSPCGECAKLIIQAGIIRVVAPKPSTEEELKRGERWVESHKWASLMFREAGVELALVPWNG